jgi:long-chain acyl-CoA synthetase
LSAIQSLSLSKSDTVLVALPLFFGYAHTAQFLVHTRLGSKIVLYDAPLFSPKRFCELVETHRVSCFTAVPSMLMMLHIYPYLEHHDLTSLRLVCFGGGGVSLDMLRSLMKRLPDTGFVQTYGQTECSPRVTALLPADSTRKIGSVGRPIPGVRVDIVSEDGTSVADGCVGEIRVQGENTCPGYYKNPEETAKIIRDGWLYTGDLAKRDEEGYIYLVGRKKNMVISGGINIYPEDVESVLRLHPSVEDVIVKGKPDDFMGEVPVAEVLCKSGCTLTLGDLHVFLRGKLATYKWPKEITLVSQLPKTATGKTKRT